MHEERLEQLESWKQTALERWMRFEDALERVGIRLRVVWSWIQARPTFLRWLTVVGSVALTFSFSLMFRQYITVGSQLMMLLPAVLVSALYGGWIAGAAAATLGAAGSVRIAFQAADILSMQQNLVALSLYLLACVIVLWLAHAQELHRRQILQMSRGLEEQIQAREQQAEAAHQELAGFCYSISHDLRAPMRNLVASSRILLEDAPEDVDPETRKRLESMVHSANRLSDLVDDLLGYARLASMELRFDRIDLSKLGRELCKRLQRHQWAFSSLECHVERDLFIGGDPELVPMLVRNLLENAFKYAKPGEKLVVKIGETRMRGKNWFFVSDNGIGFDMQYAGKIFQPFQRLHRDVEYPGTGIGLANVKRIVDRHEGEIFATSTPGKGTTFFFNLGGRELDAEAVVSKPLQKPKIRFADEA